MSKETKEKKIIKLKMPSCSDREKMVTALANSGYACWVEKEVMKSFPYNTDYYICFEQLPKE